MPRTSQNRMITPSPYTQYLGTFTIEVAMLTQTHICACCFRPYTFGRTPVGLSNGVVKCKRCDMICMRPSKSANVPHPQNPQISYFGVWICALHHSYRRSINETERQAERDGTKGVKLKTYVLGTFCSGPSELSRHWKKPGCDFQRTKTLDPICKLFTCSRSHFSRLLAVDLYTSRRPGLAWPITLLDMPGSKGSQMEYGKICQVVNDGYQRRHMVVSQNRRSTNG